ncbi:MAG: thiol:disulfide interchange protein DsbA/DsbL [bacterium]
MKLGNTLKSLLLLSVLLIPLIACGEKAPGSSHAADGIDFMEGVHYSTFPTPVLVGSDKDKIEVVEMFWYGCPHCYRLEPHVKKWEKTLPEDVEFIHLPSILNPGWALHAKAFFALDMMGEGDKLHEALFKAIHEQGRNLNSEDAIIRFANSQGIDGEALRKAMNSLPVDKKVREARKLGEEYGLTGVPALMVAGKYKVLSSGVTSYDEMFQVVDFLIKKERESRK